MAGSRRSCTPSLLPGPSIAPPASSAPHGAVKILGDIEGGTQARTGWIHAEKNIASLIIGGSMTGGGGEDSGSVATEASLGAVKIGGDLEGGARSRSGRIFAVQNIGAISIAGSMIGGAGEESGTIKIGQVSGVKQTIKTITIGGDVRGGSGTLNFRKPRPAIPMNIEPLEARIAPLTAAKNVIELSPTTADATIREV